MKNQTIKVVGGYKQPIASLPEKEKRIGGSVSKKMLNPEIDKQAKRIAQLISKGGKK